MSEIISMYHNGTPHNHENINSNGYDHVRNEYPRRNPEKEYVEVLKNLGNESSVALDLGCSNSKETDSVADFYRKIIELRPPGDNSVFRSHKDNIETVAGSTSVLPFDSESFDVVFTSLDSIDIKEIRRVLKQRGTLVFFGTGEKDSFDLRNLFTDETTIKSPIKEPFSARKAANFEEKANMFVDEIKDMANEYEYNSFFPDIKSLASYLEKHTIIPNFNSGDERSLEILKKYVKKHTDPETGEIALHRHNYIVVARKF